MLTTLVSLIPAWLKVAAGAVIAAALAFLGGSWSGRRQGRSDANSEALKKDAGRAKSIEEKADEVRSNPSRGTLSERLSKHGRLRD